MPQLTSTAVFASFVRSGRLRVNMTQEDLAQAVGKTRRWVHDVEAGKVTPSLSSAIEVAAALGFTVHLERSEPSGVLDEVFKDLG